MAKWGAIFLLAVAGTTVLADPNAIFPEQARAGATRIVSGWEAERGQFPHQLSLRMVNPAGGVSSCGGTVIHSQWGLTAAHCTTGRVTIVIRGGATNLTQPSVIFETTKYYNHPLFNDATPSVVQPNDVALLEFGRELIFSETIQPIRLQRSSARNENYAGTRAIAAGWGRTWTNGPSPENMNWVYLSLTSNIECLIAFGGSSIIQDSTICARGYNVTSQSTCSGDSGGVLSIIDIDGGVTQVGISSFVSASGCHTDVPAGFIRPGFYHDWYTQVTGINFDWEYETTPAPSTSTTPDPTTSTSPDPTTSTTPDPTTSTTLDPTTSTTPDPTTSTTSGPTTNTTPDPTISTTLPSTTPDPTTSTTPDPTTSTTSGPTTNTTPDPTISTTLPSTTPDPTTSTTPDPTTSTTPGPETSTTVDSEESSDESSSESDSSPDSSDLS